MLRIEKKLPLVDEILEPWHEAMGDQARPYTHHVYRVLHFCFAAHPCQPEEKKKLTIAGAFHGIGPWSAGTVDDSEASIEEARTYLQERGLADWEDEISRMIELHHRVRRVSGGENVLVEVLRQGDWVDLTMGWRRFGIPAKYVRTVFYAFPHLGFHNNRMRLAMARVLGIASI